MTDVLRYEVGSGTVLVEVDESGFGVDHPARNDQGILDASRRLEDALASVRPAAAAAADGLGGLAPDRLEIQFGVKLAGHAGAVIARNTTDAHFVVRMSWSPAAPSVPMVDERWQEFRPA